MRKRQFCAGALINRQKKTPLEKRGFENQMSLEGLDIVFRLQDLLTAINAGFQIDVMGTTKLT